VKHIKLGHHWESVLVLTYYSAQLLVFNVKAPTAQVRGSWIGFPATAKVFHTFLDFN